MTKAKSMKAGAKGAIATGAGAAGAKTTGAKATGAKATGAKIKQKAANAKAAATKAGAKAGLGAVARTLASADRGATHKVAERRETAPMKVAGFLAEAADQPQLITASIATIAVGLLGRRPELIRGGTRMLASHLLATAGKTALKRSFDRTRPRKAIADGSHRFARGDSHDHDLNSFPSGHTAGAVAVGLAASHEIEGAALPSAVATGAVMAAQPATGSHYLTDLVAGAAVGWAAEAVVGAVFDRFEPRIEAALVDRSGEGEADEAAHRVGGD